MSALQEDLDDEDLARGVKILGINSIAREDFNEFMCQESKIPYLQDTLDEQVWSRWDAENYIMVILDAETRVVEVYNADPYVNNLGPEGTAYSELKDRLISLAR
ncbi:MAG: hypothetical protein GF355_04860 [Candidatus Eisenbacteria bacterium]|nr:hypothetical protein [Candidatus Eisenbacteria bacterium]